MPSSRRRLQALLAGLLVVCASACASITATREPVVWAYPVVGARSATSIQGIYTDDVALATVARLFRTAYGFPEIAATIHVLPDAKSLEAALLDAGYDALFARDAASTMRAVALHRRILVNGAAMSSSSWAARVGTIAHELVHILQYDIAGGRRGTSEQWLREGFAEWIAMDVLQRIDALPAGAATAHFRDKLADSRRDQAPRLDDMRTFRQWVALAARPDIVPGMQAVLTVDMLIEQHGIQAILEYFRRFAAREDVEGNFHAVFGRSRAEFERDVDERLRLRRR
jgi:hypothetical protein